jgi:hypothetical protein
MFFQQSCKKGLINFACSNFYLTAEILQYHSGADFLCFPSFVLLCCQSLDYIVLNEKWLMNDELKRIWKEMVVLWSRYYPTIWLEGLKKPQKPSVRLDGALSKMKTKQFWNMSQDCYCYTSSFSDFLHIHIFSYVTIINLAVILFMFSSSTIARAFSRKYISVF